MSDKIVDARHDILEIKHLPPLSITASRLLSTIGDPDIEVDDLADIINQDPGLMGRIIGLANAAYFGQRNPITTVHDAIIRVLGINMVKSLAFSISVSGVFQSSSCPGFNAKEYWFNAIGCASLSRMMALRIPIAERPDPDRIYLSGLLHNLGYLVLAHVFPSKLSHVYALKEKDPEADLAALQQEYLGVDWIAAGDWLVARWNLPDFVAQVIVSAADPNYSSDDDYGVNLVRGSIRWLDGLPNAESGIPRLRHDEILQKIPGLGPEALDLIEEQFLDQSEELHSLATCI